MRVEIHNLDQLGELAKRLREAARKDLQRELYKALNRATKDARADVRESALETLPRRGGLAARVARGRLSARRRGSGIRITDRAGMNLQTIDEGLVRHPVFGHREVWVVQQVRPGFFTRPLEHAAPQVRHDVVEAMKVIARGIEG